MIFILSWRNVWRNKLRSGVMITAMALGICAGIFSTAFYMGMADQRIDKAINTEISHIQLHKPEFLRSNEISAYMPDAEATRAEINDMEHVAGVSNRIVINSMVASAETGAGVRIVGIDPQNESATTTLHEKVVEGQYFGADRRNQIVIGQKLAEKLKVRLGSKVVITLQDVENNITSGAFRIVGLFNTVNTMYDESNVFVLRKDLIRLTNLPKHSGHEIAILAKEIDDVEDLQKSLAGQFEGLTVRNWQEISPEMNYLNEAMDLYMYIFIVIILIALLFGIINTMLMAVLERTKEIGMLMAVGMNKGRVFSMIMVETIMLALTGGVFGVALGAFISKYFETHSIDLSLWGEVYANLGYDPFVYTSLDWMLLVNVTLMVIGTGIIASIYPAIKALSNDPADALRIE